MLLSISKIIKNRRQELKLTQAYLADLAEISTNTIFKIENGEANPTVAVLEKIAAVLGMEIQLAIKDTYQP